MMIYYDSIGLGIFDSNSNNSNYQDLKTANKIASKKNCENSIIRSLAFFLFNWLIMEEKLTKILFFPIKTKFFKLFVEIKLNLNTKFEHKNRVQSNLKKILEYKNN